MKISIITVTYNNHDELVQTIISIPDLPFVESVIINGGTDQRTSDYLKDYKGVHLSGKDDGIADAFNKGVRAASGDAVMFLNSGDVLINHDYLIKAADALKEKETYFTHSNLLYNDVIAGEFVMKPKIKNPGRGMLYLHPTMIVKKELFEKIGMFDTGYRIAMDYDWVIRLDKNEFKGKYIDLPPVVKMEGSGVSYNKELKAIMECYHSLKGNKYLTLSNIWGFLTRLAFYYLRRGIKMLTGKKGIQKLKAKKYGAAL